MNPITERPFRAPLLLCLMAAMVLACADTQEVNTPSGPNYSTYAVLSRTDGLAYGHFSSVVDIRSDFFTHTTAEWVEGLPEGFSYSNRTIQGDSPGAGQWAITVFWKAIDPRDNTEKQWSQRVELRFFTSLEENR